MKKIFNITLGLVAGLFMVCSCSDSDNNGPAVFSLDMDNVTVAAEGGSDKIVVNAPGEWYTATSATWVSVSPANGFGSAECTVFVDSSLVNDMRSAEIRIVAGNEVKTLTVNQTGFAKAINVKEKEIEIKSSELFDKRYFETEITTNVEFKAEFNYVTPETDWLSIEKTDVTLDYGARPRTVKLRFEWKMNSEPVERVAEINLVPLNSEDELSEPAVITVRQKAAVKIEDNRAGDSIALVTIYDLINSSVEVWDTSERMDNWNGIKLWEATDEDLPCPEAVGRVREASFSFFDTKEMLPKQIVHLKYLEKFSIMSNRSTMLLSIDLGPEICELKYLKELTMFSCGLVSLPSEFVKLGSTLEVLDLTSNNFDEVPSMLNQDNFPKLKILRMTNCRRWQSVNKLADKGNYDDGIGLNIKSSVQGDNQLRRLFLWENLEELALNTSYLEGQLPDFTVGEDGVRAYNTDDVDTFGGDTILWLADKQMPRILPNMKMLKLNLNYFTGNLPEWLLYHPYLMEWVPQSLVFPQEGDSYGGASALPRYDSEGEKTGFDNAPANFEYYYSAFPKLRAKYELKEEIGDDTEEGDNDKEESSGDEHCKEEDNEESK